MIPGELTQALETALLRELLTQWKNVNASYFKGALRPPSIELTASRHVLGRWDRSTRTLEMSRPLLLAQPWGVVVEVLKHEMAHQYVHEVLGETLETAHGPAFRAACHRLGIDGAASGLPDAQAAQTPEEAEAARVVERIARLLALAESPNIHEAEAATLAAQRLMLKYNLEARARETHIDYGFRHLGRPNGRVGEAERVLAMLLGRHFFVEVIWVPSYRPGDGKRGSVLEICGSSSNLAMAEYVHAFLTHTAEQLWTEHKRTRGIQANRDRRTFLAGVMAGFADKLARDAKVHEQAGLVWVADANLHGFFRRRHPYVRHVRHAGTRRTEAFGHGREAGRKIVLRRGVHAAPTQGHSARLLPARRSS